MAKKKASGKKAAQQQGKNATHKPGGGFAKGNPYRFEPGVSGNPKGRPPGPDLTYRAIKYFDKKVSEVPAYAKRAKKLGLDPKTATVADVFIAAAIANGTAGKSEYFRHLYERIEGKIKEHVEVSGGVKLYQTIDGFDPDEA